MAAKINAAYNGYRNLTGETWVVAGGGIPVNFFTMDYSAPEDKYTELVFGKVDSLFSGVNETKYNKRMVDKRKRERGVMMSGRGVL